MARAYERKLIEKEERKKASSNRVGDGMDSQRGGFGPLKKPSSMQVNQDYTSAASPTKKGGNLGLPQVGRKDSQQSVNAPSRLRGQSRTNFDNGSRDSPVHNRMNARESAPGKTRNKPIGFFMTQQETTTGSLPRTGAQGFRNHKVAPLLSPNQQRGVGLHQSQAFSPNSSPEPNTLDVEKERSKITRFIQTKERSGQMFQARESRIEARLKELEKKQKDFEKKKIRERKQADAKLRERYDELAERKAKIDEQNKELENKSVFEYRKAVLKSKKEFEAEYKPEKVKKGRVGSKDELAA